MINQHGNLRQMIKKNPTILVKLRLEDFSLSPVMQYARWFANCFGGSTHLFLSVYKKGYEKQSSDLGEHQRKAEAHALSEAKKKLDSCVSALKACDLNVGSSLNWKVPTEPALARCVEDVNPDYMLATRPRATLFDRAVVSDPDWKVIQGFDVPVIFIHDAPSKFSKPIVWAAVDPMHSDTQNLRLNDLIVEHTKELAAKINAVPQLFHAYGTAIGLPEQEQPPTSETGAEPHNFHLTALENLADRHGIPHSQIINVPGLAQIVLPVLVAKRRPQFVVAGANKRGHLGQILFGNTANKLMHRLPGALCIVRLPNAEI